MKIIRTFCAIFWSLFAGTSVYADSPLTSTDICIAYQDVAIVQKASKAKGRLTDELMAYLSDARHPVDVKIALINQLGWDPKGRNNASGFFKYLKKRYHYKSKQDFLASSDSDAIICLAYLKALDDYFDVEEAFTYAAVARYKSTGYTTHIIYALIAAQRVLYEDGCQVYHCTHSVRMDKSLKVDMRQEAIGVIFDYMDIYKEGCGD